MIILKHLTVERFRLLREVNLHFPQRGSILIQGPNEAGKSALFESIYFALYGETLALDRGTRSLDDLIYYGASSATVDLILAVGAKELQIKRTIERGKNQQVMLTIRRLGVTEEEPITRLGTANERIIAELGQMDGPTLRNSYLVEQKALSRLENLRGQEREVTLRKLLGLEKLTRLTEHFKLTENDERFLKATADRLALAEMQAQIPEISTKLAHIEAALDAVTVSEDLAAVSEQQGEITEQEIALEALRLKRNELKSRQGRIAQLKKADATLNQIIDAYDSIAEARREIPELERQINELDRREHEELPALEKRVNDLADLTHSFGTLERLAADLLTAVNTIKELEQEHKEHQSVQNDLKELDEEIIRARTQLDKVRQAQYENEERKRAGRPLLETRLQRLQKLAGRLTDLRQAEERYAQTILNQGLAEENAVKLKKVLKDLQDTEQELKLVEAESRQIQQQSESIEARWRQLSINRQLEEWQRLKRLSQGLADAEQHVRIAHQQQEQLTSAALSARRTVTNRLVTLIICAAVAILGAGGALFEFQQNAIFGSVLGLIAVAAIGLGIGTALTYKKARDESQSAEQQMQEAITKVGMMVAAREAAVRMGGDHKALVQIEHEIRTLGGEIPRSLDDVNRVLQQKSGEGYDSLADIQNKMTETRDSLAAARNQVNVTMEALASLRKERTRLEEQRKKEAWDEIVEKIDASKAEVEQIKQEVITKAAQEGLSLPKLEPSQSLSATDSKNLQKQVEDSIKAVELEIATIDGKIEAVSDLTGQIKLYQDSLDVLLARKQTITERRERFHSPNPQEQIERAREQQVTLRSALQSLQDSLRQRVKPMGVAFGQAAINSAEAAARKQLELLHITLGSRIELQSRHDEYARVLKERQDSLAEHYQQLAKFSGSLGSWIVPLNPFAEALEALRARCQHELQEANEKSILQELEKIQLQEGAFRAKIDLCNQEIEEVHERIATMLAQRSRPTARGYTFTDIVAVWPLVGDYSSEDRKRLEDERENLEKTLQTLEEQELTLSAQLQAGGNKLDLEQARLRMEQQERSYQTKKRGSLLVSAVSDRLMQKMLPRTEYFMQQLLPLLTSGRYHDVHLTTEPEEGAVTGGPLQLRIWDSAASEYVTRSALSSGAGDQISFALRLAFAISALPRELGSAPGFMLLDEPLSSFDRKRTQSVVDVVTGDLLGQHFEQILFISQSSTFDPALFPYHIYMDGGMVIESNLPVVATLPVVETTTSEIMQTPVSTTAELAMES